MSREASKNWSIEKWKAKAEWERLSMQVKKDTESNININSQRHVLDNKVSYAGQIKTQNRISNHIKIQNNCVQIYRNMSMNRIVSYHHLQ